MPGDTARENGKNGGRPKGSLNEVNRLARAKEAWFKEKAASEMEQIYQALKDAAMGVLVTVTTPKGDVKVYRRPPNITALQEFLNRLWGKPNQPISGDLNINHELSDPIQKRLDEWHGAVGSRKASGDIRRVDGDAGGDQRPEGTDSVRP